MIINFANFIDCAGEQCPMIIAEPHRIVTGYDVVNQNSNYFYSDYLYLGKVSNLPKEVSSVVNTNLILFLDAPIPKFLKECNTINLILVKDMNNFISIQKNIKQIFNTQIRINNYTQYLLNLCENSCTLDQMLNYAYFAIGNPLMLVDASLFLVKEVGMDSVCSEPIITSTLQNGFLPEEYLTEVIYKETRSSVPQDDLIVYETQLLNHRLFASRIIKNNRLFGYIKVIEINKPVTQLEEKYMIILSKYLSIRINDFSEFTSNCFSINPLVDSFLIGLLEKKILDPEEIEKRAKSLKLDFSGTKCVITIKPNFTLKNTDSLYILKRRLVNLLNKDSIIVYNNNVIILFNLQQTNLTERHKSDFIKIIESNNCKAFVSLPFYELNDFEKHYTQTQSCILIAEKLNINKTIIKYEDYMIEHMFVHFNNTYNIYDLIHPSIKLLIKIDDEQNSELLDSLFCLLEHGNNFTSAANELNIHYNTLKYRINRIIELTNLDLTDNEVIFSLLMSKKILELVNNQYK